MKILTFFLFVLMFGFSGYAQTKPPSRSPNVQIATTEVGATSELLPISITTPPNIISAKIGFKYFGANSDSDTSVVLILKGTKGIYSNGNFGVKISIDDIPLKADKYRAIIKVDKNVSEEILHFYINDEETAWIATGEKISISVFNTDTNKKHDTFSLSAANLKEFKDFARSVLLIKSYF